MMDAVSIIVGAALGAVATASLYEIIIRKRMNRLMSIMSRARIVNAEMEILAGKIEELKNKKGGDKK